MNRSCFDVKTELRRKMRALRAALTQDEAARASASVCEKLKRALTEPDPGVFSQGKAVAVYLASGRELDISGFIQALLERGVKTVAPRWNGETYTLAGVASLRPGDLRAGPMGIPEPVDGTETHPSEVGVWIVPGLAFTTSGKRLGYGGGWYDRLLAGAAEDSVKIGVAHAFQIVDDIPSEPHDIPLDALVDTGDAAAAPPFRPPVS